MTANLRERLWNSP